MLLPSHLLGADVVALGDRTGPAATWPELREAPSAEQLPPQGLQAPETSRENPRSDFPPLGSALGHLAGAGIELQGLFSQEGIPWAVGGLGRGDALRRVPTAMPSARFRQGVGMDEIG